MSSKKSFTTAPKPINSQPPPEDIAAFEDGGAGHDDRPGASTPVGKTAPKAKAEPTKRLSIDLPLSIHKRFKVACTATDSKMSGELQKLIARRTRELEKQAGIS